MKPLSIVWITSRRDCKLAWFVDSLARSTTQEERDNIQLILVDRHLWSKSVPEIPRGTHVRLASQNLHDAEREAEFRSVVYDRFNYLHIPVKPCMWQGPFRLTSKDWFCASQARNTGIIAALHPYVVFVDDLSVALPTWWPQVKHAADSSYCVAGMYKKLLNLVVEDGEVKSFTENPSGVDSRWSRGSDAGIVPWSGAGLFGCSFGAPLELLLTVNGNDETTDGQSAEDYDLGIRLERAGGKFWLNRNMLTYESEEMHAVEPSLPRESKLVSPDRLPPGYTGNPMSDHVMLNRVTKESRFTTIGGTDLRSARDEFLASGCVKIPTEPTHDWRDGKPLAEL